MGVKTIQDIADIVGCSSGTVSRAINNRPGINAETRRRILAVMEEVGYRPNAIAQSLASRQTHTVALVIPDISVSLLSGIALAADRELSRHKYNIMLYNTCWDAQIEQEKLRFAAEKRVDGIVIKPVGDDIACIRALHVPTVLISHTSRENVCCIDMENDTAGYVAAGHLLQCRYERVAFIGGPRAHSATQLRLEGYRRALHEQNVPFDERYVAFGENYSIDAGYRAMSAMMCLPAPPDAFFCSSDAMALGVCQRAAELGLAIPDACGVVGCNNDPLSALAQIQLTTIDQPVGRMGRLAAELLIDQIENGGASSTQKVMLYPELIIRSTTRAVRRD